HIWNKSTDVKKIYRIGDRSIRISRGRLSTHHSSAQTETRGQRNRNPISKKESIERSMGIMNFRYLPMTEADKEAMLETIGIQSTEELFADIPDGVRLKNGLNLKKGLDEAQLKKELMNMANKNANLLQNSSFLGAGVYDH